MNVPIRSAQETLDWYVLEKGLSVKSIDLKQHQPTTYTSIPHDDDIIVLKFIVSLKGCENNGLNSVCPFNAIALQHFTGNDTYLIELPAISRCLLFQLDAPWLDDNYPRALGILHNLSQLSEQTVEVNDEMNKRECIGAEEILDALTNYHLPKLRLKTLCLDLLNAFFEKFILKHCNEANQSLSPYYSQMLLIANRLQRCVGNDMINLDNLSREFHLSKSTLKRHFKLVFNKSISVYFIEQKIAFGKALLERNNKSINEVAYLLGYQKPNSFSQAFRKMYGMLPNEFLSKKQQKRPFTLHDLTPA